MKRLIILTTIALSVLGVTLASPAVTSPANAAQASAVRLEPPVRHAKTVKVSYVHKSKHDPKWIEFNTGSLWSVRACKHEDSNNCYWSAKRRGDGKGRSFVTLHGKTYFTNLL